MNPQPKETRIEMPHYLKWGRKLPCQNPRCKHRHKTGDTVPAHQNFGYGHMAGKSHDLFAIFICFWCHDDEHHAKKTFWDGIDTIPIIFRQLEMYGKEYPKMVFWTPFDFNMMLIGAVVQRQRDFLAGEK